MVNKGSSSEHELGLKFYYFTCRAHTWCLIFKSLSMARRTHFTIFSNIYTRMETNCKNHCD